MEARRLGHATLQLEDRSIPRAVMSSIPELGAVVRFTGADFYVFRTSAQFVLCREVVIVGTLGEVICRFSAPGPLDRWLRLMVPDAGMKGNGLRWLPEGIAAVLEVDGAGGEQGGEGSATEARK